MIIQHEVRVVCTQCLMAQTLEESTPWRGALTYGPLTVSRLKNANPFYQLFLEGCRSQAVDPAFQTPSGLAQASITAPANYIARISVASTQISSLAYKKTSKHTKDALAAEASRRVSSTCASFCPDAKPLDQPALWYLLLTSAGRRGMDRVRQTAGRAESHSCKHLSSEVEYTMATSARTKWLIMRLSGNIHLGLRQRNLASCVKGWESVIG